MRIPIGLATICILGGCASTPNVDLPTAARADSTAAFRLYQGAGVVLVDHLRVTEDSVLGIRVREHPNAASFPVAIPLAQVDSVKQAHPDQEVVLLILAPIAVIGGFLLYLSSLSFD